MKAIFGILLCYVFLSSQCYAIKGGPVYPGTTSVNVLGTYAAILLPKEPLLGPKVNSLGLFTLMIPQTGLASGNVFVFRGGVSYTGTIQGAADPATAKLYAVIDASFSRTVETTDTSTLVYESLAAGELNGNKIIAVSSFASTAYRITGDAVLQFSSQDPIVPNQPREVNYTILGFKQA